MTCSSKCSCSVGGSHRLVGPCVEWELLERFLKFDLDSSFIFASTGLDNFTECFDGT